MLNSEIYLLFSAVLLDIIFAEPPNRAHPVVWFGKITEIFKKIFTKIEKYGAVVQFYYGVLTALLVILFSLFLLLLPIPYPYNYLWHLFLLFSSFSITSMIRHAKKCVKTNFEPSEVQKIVSRDTKKLNKPQLRSAVIESTAENFVDGVFAPLFYFSIFGIAGAVVYRAINTLDSMIGYRGRYEFFGKFSARLDDIANYIPARVSLIFFEILKRGSFSYGLKNKVKLNGCTISAMSYVLGVKLEKPGFYSLPGRYAEDEDVWKTIKLFKILSIMAIILSVLLLLLRNYFSNFLI
ncbi:MAG: adenosylcobinamide-phosphate synthase CbiB [Archaeoglobaceae archaeon]|nr:adenosylcobinamide-phosphate synthase CbiB [Archaeoglobaceae archaeon]